MPVLLSGGGSRSVRLGGRAPFWVAQRTLRGRKAGIGGGAGRASAVAASASRFLNPRLSPALFRPWWCSPCFNGLRARVGLPITLGNERTAIGVPAQSREASRLRHGSQPSHRQSRRRSARPPRVSRCPTCATSCAGWACARRASGSRSAGCCSARAIGTSPPRCSTTRRCAPRVPVSLATVYNTLHQFTEAGLLRQLAVDGSKAYFRHEPDRASSLLRGGRGGADGRADPGRHRARPARGAGVATRSPASTSWCACAVWTPPRRPPGTCARRADATVVALGVAPPSPAPAAFSWARLRSRAAVPEIGTLLRALCPCAACGQSYRQVGPERLGSAHRSSDTGGRGRAGIRRLRLRDRRSGLRPGACWRTRPFSRGSVGTRPCLLEAGARRWDAGSTFPSANLFAHRQPRADWMFRDRAGAGLERPAARLPQGQGDRAALSAINAMIYMRATRRTRRLAQLSGGLGLGRRPADLPPATRITPGRRPPRRGGDTVDYPQPPPIHVVIEACVAAGIPSTDDFKPRRQIPGWATSRSTRRAAALVRPARGFLKPGAGAAQPAAGDRLTMSSRTRSRTAAPAASSSPARERVIDRAAGEVILSAGAVNSPQLLELSGVGDGARLQALGVETRRHLPGVARTSRTTCNCGRSTKSRACARSTKTTASSGGAP